MAVTTESPAPYAPASAIIDLIDRRRNRGLQAPINADVLGRAGVSESLVPRTLQSLQALDLIDETGAPTPVFEGIRAAPEDELKRRMEEWLKAAYAEVFAYVDPMKDDETRIRDAFRAYQPHGQQARMVTLFTGLCRAAGLMPEASSGTPRPAQTQRPRPASAPRSAVRPNLKTQLKPPSRPGGLPPALLPLFESLPDVSEGWTTAERDRFLATLKALLDFYIPVVKEGEKKSAVHDLTA